MDELERQRNKKTVIIELNGKEYKIKNPYLEGADQLQFSLAEQLYDSIRCDKTDVKDISEASTLKIENVQKCKDHIFYNKHLLDQYAAQGVKSEYKRFDPNLLQALAWERLKAGIRTEEDLEWLRHEFVEQKYEKENNSGYAEAHAYAQSRFNGDPWKDNWESWQNK